MLTIRLQRIGKRKQPYYRLVISEKTRDTQAKSLEILGNYGPTENPKVLNFNTDRIKYWLSVGAQTSNTVNNLLVKAGIIEAAKKKSVSISNKRKAKMEKSKAEEEAVKAKKIEAEKAALEAKKAAEEEAKKAAEETKKAEEEAAKKAAEEAKQAEVEKPVEEVIEEKKEEVIEEKKAE